MTNKSIAFPIWLTLLSLCTATLRAEKIAEVELWPDRAPGLAADETLEIVVEQTDRVRERVTKVSAPKITVYKPAKDKDTGAAVLICPGGGYHILAYDLEGTEVAEWLNRFGVTGVVLHYRVPRAKDAPKHVGPLQDAQRALRLCRQNAEQWQIDPDRLGILGFSAGGHLAATTATNSDRSTYEPVDDADSLSCRPDFAVLIYPAYLTGEGGGDSIELSDEIRVNENTPPSLMIHAGDDRISPTNSIAFYMALKKHGVPAELHIYPTGGHGYGLRPTEHAVTTWPQRAETWMEKMGLLEDDAAE